MRVAQLETFHLGRSLWAELWEREKDLPLVSPLSAYPAYRHPYSTWYWDPGMTLVVLTDAEGRQGLRDEEIRETLRFFSPRHTRSRMEGQERRRTRLQDQFLPEDHRHRGAADGDRAALLPARQIRRIPVPDAAGR